MDFRNQKEEKKGKGTRREKEKKKKDVYSGALSAEIS